MTILNIVILYIVIFLLHLPILNNNIIKSLILLKIFTEHDVTKDKMVILNENSQLIKYIWSDIE